MMPYTLAMGALWFALALLVGLLIGWLVRSIVATRQVSRARNQNVDQAELERLRSRVAGLEAAAAERDEHRAEPDAARAAAASAPEVAAGPEAATETGPVVTTETGSVVQPDSEPEPDANAGSGSASGSVPGSGSAGSQPANGVASPPAGALAPETAPETAAELAAEMGAAAEILGEEIELDDLKVVEGIGPKVESLCHGIGIRTWHDLSTTEVSLLKTMLDDAGPRFRTHDPSTWPEQAGLLAAGRWSDFRELTRRVGHS